MRFLHTADWHLGRRLLGTSLLEDQAFLLERLIEVARDEAVDAVVIAGDVYDHSRPPEGAVELLDWALNELALSTGIPVLLIPGNHDSAPRLGFGARALEKGGVHIRASADDLAPVVLEDDAGPVAFHLLPFAEPAHVRHSFGDESIQSHADVLTAQVKRSLDSTSKACTRADRRVCVAHGFIMGGDAADSEAERPLTVGTVSAAPLTTFEAFSYTALGHLHRPHSPSQGGADGANSVVRYAGSLFPYAIDEIAPNPDEYGKEKGVTLVEIDAAGAAQADHCILAPRRVLRRVEASFDELLAASSAPSWRDDYLVIKLSDKRAILDAMPRLRERYPNLLALEPREIDIEGEIARPSGEDRKKPINELFSDFWRGVTEEQLSEKEERYLAAAIEESRQNQSD